MKLFIILFSLLMMSRPLFAATPEQCQSARQHYYQTGGQWPATCGRKPDPNYLNALKKDCAATVRRIEVRNVEPENFASWNSEWGWAAEETCESLQRGDQL